MKKKERLPDKFLDSITEIQKSHFRESIAHWSRSHELRWFPWRATNQEYQLLIAEILLRRTNAKAVNLVFDRFIKKFPELRDFSEATEEEVFELTKSLGLNWRTNNLLSLAQFVREQPADYKLPNDIPGLLKLPGVGPYVARALMINAHNSKLIAIDSNVTRLVCRYFGLKFSDNLRRNRTFQSLCDSISDSIDVESPRQFNYAILDISARFCRPTFPKCKGCPLSNYCVNGAEEQNGK